MKINENYQLLKNNYLFAVVADKAAEYRAENPYKPLISLGIGDVTLPLCDKVVKGLIKGAEDMGKAESFKGYGPYAGYDFLREKIMAYYEAMGAKLSLAEIFVSDGGKSDSANITDLFSKDNTILVPDPVYPVYVDTNLMNGREIIYADANEANGFLPMPDENVKADIIYMCSPNNPTGAVYNRAQLKAWVDYANANDALIIFDAAYEAFISDPELPRSIMLIEGAETCAIEICSLSKTAGFTGTRCGYTIIPEKLTREGQSLNKMWLRRQSTKFNGVSYIIQKGAEAVFTEEGLAETRSAIAYYKNNAKTIMKAFDELGIWYCGGEHSPYVWMKCPNNIGSWDMFDIFLKNANVVTTPGEGFGKNGEGFIRLTSFSTAENTAEAMRRIKLALEAL